MEETYINTAAVISAQQTFEENSFLEDVQRYEATELPVIDPDYKKYISPGAARRMAKGIKMGVVASLKALEGHEDDSLDAIITGTAMGGVQDSEKFLSTILDNDEEFLTPTAFIQSTHNTVAGQIALAIKCKAYNMTYVHGSTSFESALMDAQLQISAGEASKILVGGVDEIGEETIKFHRAIDLIKAEPVHNMELLHSNSAGSLHGEGASFFLLSNKKTSASYAKLIDVLTFNTIQKEELEEEVLNFLNQNNFGVENIDVVILGKNGDVNHDFYYDELAEGVFANTTQVYYKHLSGEFGTASGFGFWLGSKILKEQRIPQETLLDTQKHDKLQNILLYNQYIGEGHSFTLLQRC